MSYHSFSLFYSVYQNVYATLPSDAAVRAAAAAAAARRSRLEVPARLQMLAGGDKSLVKGLQSILQNLKSLTLVSPQSSSSVRAASAADAGASAAHAGGTRGETAAQQETAAHYIQYQIR